MELTLYQQEITKYNKAAAKKAADGGSPYLHKGKADIFRYFFCLLAGLTAVTKLINAFQTADEKAEAKTGWTLKERLNTVRNTLWEGTIERRIKQITEGCFKKVVAKATDRSRAVQIIMKRMIDRGEDRVLTDSQFDRIVNYRLKSCGFSA